MPWKGSPYANPAYSPPEQGASAHTTELLSEEEAFKRYMQMSIFSNTCWEKKLGLYNKCEPDLDLFGSSVFDPIEFPSSESVSIYPSTSASDQTDLNFSSAISQQVQERVSCNPFEKSAAVIPKPTLRAEEVASGWLVSTCIEPDLSGSSTLDRFGYGPSAFKTSIPTTTESFRTYLNFSSANDGPVYKTTMYSPSSATPAPVLKVKPTSQGISKLAQPMAPVTATTLAQASAPAPGTDSTSTPVVAPKLTYALVPVFARTTALSREPAPVLTNPRSRKQKQSRSGAHSNSNIAAPAEASAHAAAAEGSDSRQPTVMVPVEISSSFHKD